MEAERPQRPQRHSHIEKMFTSVAHGQTIFRDIIFPGPKCFIKNAGVFIESCDETGGVSLEFVHKPLDTTKPASLFDYNVGMGFTSFNIESSFLPGFIEVKFKELSECERVKGIWFFYEWTII
jgi:hypothetical protein